MPITRKDVEYVARLARLELSDAEKEQYAGQLENILKYVDTLNEVDTTDVPPTNHALNLTNVWREDVCVPSTAETREHLLNNAPQRDGDFFRVKKIIE
jgi:aspartyl-tRNA(Asn)/glutamyl-tRNA(Gln) amidotransferase subunit C